MGPAPFFQLLGLGAQLRVLIGLQELRFQFPDHISPGSRLASQVLEHFILQVEVVEVAVGPKTQGPLELGIQTQSGDIGRRGELFQKLCGAVPSLDHDPPHPGEVIQPHVLQVHIFRRCAAGPGRRVFQAPGDVAEAHRPHTPVFEHRFGDDPCRVREVDQPGLGCIRP